MSETMMSDFVRSRRELKYSLNDIMDWSKDLEEKYQSMALLVETLSQANFKKDKKIQQLKQKVQKYKSKAKSNTQPLRSQSFPTTTPDGKYVIHYQEFVDLSEELDCEEEKVIEEQEEEEEEGEVEIIEIEENKRQHKIKVKEEPDIPIAPPSTPNHEVVEMEEVVEVDIEPALEPDSEEESEPEMQPTEEPVLEKEEEVEKVEEELYETTINGKSYYVTNETNGPIYAIAEDEEVGDKVGQFVNGKATFQVSDNASHRLRDEGAHEVAGCSRGCRPVINVQIKPRNNHR